VFKKRKIESPIVKPFVEPSIHFSIPVILETKKSWEDFARPSSINDVKGQEEGKKTIFEWLKNPLKPLLLCGPSGCGKTCLIKTCLESVGYWIWDESLLAENDTLSEAIKHFKITQGFKKTAVLIECIEGIHSEERKGLISAIDSKNVSNIPIIFTTDDDFNKSAKLIKKKCFFLKLKKLDSMISKKLLIDIAQKHTFPLSINSAENLLESSQDNVRQAINSMQFMILTKHRQKTNGESALKECDDKFDIFNITRQICSGIFNEQLESLVKSDIDFFLNMIIENHALFAKDISSAARAYDSLGLSNIILSQIEIDSSRMTNEHFDLAAFIASRSVSLACQNSRNSGNIKFMTFFKVKQDSQIRKKLLLQDCSEILASHDEFYLKQKMFQNKHKFPKDMAKLLGKGLFNT
jgi:DNA polymerase III delta prime subunit